MVDQHLRQDATWWSVTFDGYGGATFGSPTLIRCRWEERSDKFMDRSGEEKISRARVYVDRDIAIQDWLYLGDTVITDPRTLLGAYPVQQFHKTPDLRNLSTLRKAIL